jgi:hypothetical protein
VFLANFRKPKYASGLLNESVVNRFNSKIEEIDKVIGDDYSFLEFSTIVKEEKEELPQTLKSEPDYVKAVFLLTKFFDPERDIKTGSPVNVIILNGGLFTKRLVEEAELINAKNKSLCVLVHVKNIRSKSYGASEENIEKILAKLVDSMPNIFCDYKMIDNLSYHEVLRKLRPKYEPCTVTVDYDDSYIKKEIEGLSAIYSYPVGLLKSVKVGQHRDPNKKIVATSLEKDSYKEFCSNTPECLHPYWKDIKNSFDKYTYKDI